MTHDPRLVFVVDDHADVGRVVCRALEEQGLHTEAFTRARAFLSRLKTHRPALCIVDLGLPDEDGLTVVRTVQSEHGVPVIILTGRGAVIDRVLGLELGADDYVVKPFDARELVARVKAVLRRSERPAPAEPGADVDLARFGAWSFDFNTHTLVDAAGHATELSAAEAQLLMTFLRAPNRILSRETLLSLRGTDERSPFDRSIDVRVSRLRQKLERDPKEPRFIKTVYGAGYMFTARVEWLPKD
jgi:DNA-binding response OmpR family regulator